MDAEERKELGRQVAAARIRAGLGKEGAARKASVSSITWKKVEDGLNVSDVNRFAVLHVVGLDGDGPKSAMPELHEIADTELLAEIARRFARSSQPKESEPRGNTPATSGAAADRGGVLIAIVDAVTAGLPLPPIPKPPLPRRGGRQ
jgi:hypothetical protein